MKEALSRVDFDLQRRRIRTVTENGWRSCTERTVFQKKDCIFNLMEITGIWVGTTRLGEGYEGAEGRCINFLLELKETEDGLTGRVIDDDILVVFKMAIPVTGVFEFDTLSLTRNYPFGYYFNPADNFLYRCPESEPYGVAYAGSFAEDKVHISGGWELLDNIKSYGTSAQGFQGYGDWAMRRPTADELEMFRTMAENAGVPFDFEMQDTEARP